MAIAWPAFLLAGVLEMLVFAVVDPSDLHSFAGQPLAWSRQAIYTVAFFVFWAVTAASSALSVWLIGAAVEGEGNDPAPGRPKPDQPPRGAATRAAAERGGDTVIRKSAD